MKTEACHLEENKDKTSEITINLIKPTDNNAQIENMLYLDYDGNLNIQILDRKATIKNDGNYDQEYRFEIQYPEEIRRRKDTIRIKYRFKDYRPSIIEAFYNDKSHNIWVLMLLISRLKIEIKHISTNFIEILL